MEKTIEIYGLLHYKKIEFNWNKNPIKMEDFTNMLTVSVESNTECLGYWNGWRSYENKEHNLKIRGGIVNGYGLLLDSIEYGIKLHNPYNNFVNPFFLDKILTTEGFNFFIDYYSEEINDLISKIDASIVFHKQQICLEEDNKEWIEQILKHRQ